MSWLLYEWLKVHVPSAKPCFQCKEMCRAAETEQILTGLYLCFCSILQAITSSIQRKSILKSRPGISAEFPLPLCPRARLGRRSTVAPKCRVKQVWNWSALGWGQGSRPSCSPPAHLGKGFAHWFLLFSLLLVNVKTVLFCITQSEASELQLPRQQNILCSCRTSYNDKKKKGAVCKGKGFCSGAG